MDETMSSSSFSHQFYQHWTRTPEQVRAAIVQELTDITTVLQPDIPIGTFAFSSPDLDTHLDDLYRAHDTQQTQHLTEREQQRIVEEKTATETANKHQKNDEAQSDKNIATLDNNTTIETVSHAENSAANADEYSDNNKANVITNGKTQNIIIKPNHSAAIESAPIIPNANIAHENLIQELGAHIDDYLSEQMAQLSEDLKSWLRDEISRQLAGQGKTADSIDNKNAPLNK